MKHNNIDLESLNKLAQYDQARCFQMIKKQYKIVLNKLEDCNNEDNNKQLVMFIKETGKALLTIYFSKAFSDSKLCRAECDDTIFNLLALKLNDYKMNTSYDFLNEHYVMTLEK